MKNTLHVLVAVFALALTADAASASSSPWSISHGGKLRLIAPGGGTIDGKITAGIEIALDPGWKTYWRQPGDGGVPPYFDHSASINAETVKIDFPAPHRYTDQGGITIGYKDLVVFPIAVTPNDPDQPVVLDLKIEYGICEEICVPATANARLVLSPSMTPDKRIAQKLKEFAAAVPGPADDKLSVKSVERKDKSLEVRTALAEPDAPHDLFVEGPEAWYLPPPEKTAINGTEATWTIPLEWIPKKAKIPGTELRFTLVNGNRAAEQEWRLD